MAGRLPQGEGGVEVIIDAEAWAFMSRRVDELTRRFPPETPCRIWPGAKEGEGKPDAIRTAFAIAPSCDIVVWVEDYPGWIAATHVDDLDVGVLDAKP